MRRHDRSQAMRYEFAKGQQIGGFKLHQPAGIHRQLRVGIGRDKPVSRKVLAACRHTGQGQSFDQCAGQLDHRPRLRVKSTVTDYRAVAEVQIENRSEAQIDAMGTQFRGQNVTGIARKAPCALWVTIPHRAQCAHRRHAREALAKSLHPSTLMIHRNQQWRTAQAANRAGQFFKLARRFVISREQDDTAGQRMGQTSAIGIGELPAFDVEHDRTGGDGCIHGFTAPERRLRMPVLFRETSLNDDG